MAIRYEDVLASMPADSRQKIAEGAERQKAHHLEFLELQRADPTARETPEFFARLSALPEEYRTELMRQEAERAGFGALKKQVEALGGKLRVTAEFPGETLVIDGE